MLTKMHAIARASSVVLVCAGAVGCVPDAFSYSGSSGAGGGGAACDFDECQEPQCPAGQRASDSGQCVPICDETWASELDAWVIGGLLVEPEGARVWLAGATSNDGREPTAAVSVIEGCNGALQTLIPVADEEPSKASGIAFVGEALIVAGSEHSDTTPSAAFVAKVDPDPLQLIERSSVVPSGAGESLFDLTASADYAWSVGQTEIAGSARAFAVKSAAGEDACSFAFGTSPGAARAAAASAGRVLVAGENGGSIVLWGFDDAACSPPACVCAPTQTSAPLLPAGAASAQVSDLVLIGSAAYVSGSGLGGDGRTFGFVLSLDAGSLSLAGWAKLSPASGDHAVLALASDGERLFAGGAYGMQAAGALDTGTSFVSELPVPLAPDAAPLWLETVAGTTAVTALGSEPGPSGALFVGTSGGIGLGRCTKLGSCPIPSLQASAPR